jgi:ABC-type multidrug transport system ATPase subunit
MLNKIVVGNSLHHFTHEREEKRAQILLNREFEFVNDKINVLVGENGSGKSSLLATIAKKLLAYNFGHTRLDDRLIRFADEYWQKEDPDRWYTDDVFMPDVTLETSGDVYGTYVSADWTPCDAADWAHAVCYGLGDEATDHFKRVHDFSSGQGMRNVIEFVFETMQKPSPKPNIDSKISWYLNDKERSTHLAKRAQTLEPLLPKEGSNIVALFDEPERPLDIGAQILFWKNLNRLAKLPHVQIIIATHSVIPLMTPDNFNFVEMNAGYANKLLDIVDEEFK